MSTAPENEAIAALDRAIIRATQAGLPLVPEPYAAVAAELGVDAATVLERLEAMRGAGVVRRVGLVPHHYNLGYTANAMTVWDVDDAHVDALGERVGALACVSHCYQRPRHRPIWPYNLFAMVHGRRREDLEAPIAAIGELLGEHLRASDVLYSTEVLKKTGLRLSAKE